MAIKSFRFNKRYGGIGYNPNLVGEGQMTDIRGLNIRDKAPLILPSKAADSTDSTTTTNEMHGMIDNFIFGEDGDIYIVSSTTGAITLNDTSSSIDFFCGVVRAGEPILLGNASTTPTLYKYSGGTQDSRGAWSGGTRGTYSPTSWSSVRNQSKYDNYSMATIGGSLYIGMGEKLVEVDYAGTATNCFDGDLDSDIVSLTVSGQTLFIYLRNGDCLLWDRFDSWDEKLSIHEPIRTVSSYGGIDYIITGTDESDSGFYVRVGREFQPISGDRYGMRFHSSNPAGTKMAFHNGIVYLPSYWDQASYAGVASYGGIVPGLSSALNVDYIESDGGNDYQTIGFVGYFNGAVFVGYYDGTNYGIDRYILDPNTGTRGANGFFVTPVFDGGARNVKKRLVEIRAHGDVSGSDEITVGFNSDKFYTGAADRRSLINDDYADFTTIATIDDTDSDEQNDRYGVVVDKEFYACQFKVDLTANATLSELEVIYEELD